MTEKALVVLELEKTAALFGRIEDDRTAKVERAATFGVLKVERREEAP